MTRSGLLAERELELPRPPVAMLLDFDGVVVASVALKVQAFLDVYAGAAPDKLAAITDYQRAHGGVTRRLKFEHFETTLFGRPLDRAEIDRLTDAYASRVHQAVVRCPLIRGAADFLERAHRRTDLHVVSGTPQEELADIIEQRGLARYFKSIHGAPATKLDAFRSILDENGYPASRVIAVGDSTTEYDAATALGIPFLGIVDPDDNPFPATTPVRPSLVGLGEFLMFPPAAAA